MEALVLCICHFLQIKRSAPVISAVGLQSRIKWFSPVAQLPRENQRILFGFRLQPLRCNAWSSTSPSRLAEMFPYHNIDDAHAHMPRAAHALDLAKVPSGHAQADIPTEQKAGDAKPRDGQADIQQSCHIRKIQTMPRQSRGVGLPRDLRARKM